MTAQQTVPPAPTWDALVKLKEKGWEGVPDGPSPFYFGAKDGLFLHKRTLLGRGVAKMEYWPSNFPEFGARGDFIWEADPIPAKIMGQIVNFFERIYDYQHTEAMVLLLMHAETKEWRTFIPTQLVSHGGVNYVFDPEHIQYPWILVGSIHSHCDFGAGHSSTDTGDADGFEGFHATIGYIKRDIPQIVAMIATNKKLLHYKPEDFPALFDFTEVKQHEAPKWWDRYVEDTVTKTKPVGFELYKKFQKSTLVKVETVGSTLKQISGPPGAVGKNGHAATCRCWNCNGNSYYGQNTDPNRGVVRYNPDEWVWSESEKRLVKKGEAGNQHQMKRDHDYSSRLQSMASSQQGHRGYADLARLVEIDDGPMTASELIGMGFEYNEDLHAWVAGEGTNMVKITGVPPGSEHDAMFAEREGRRPRYADLDEFDLYSTLYWEDEIPYSVETKGLLLASNLLTEEDIEQMIAQPRLAMDERFWKDMFFDKAMNAIEALQAIGVDARLNLRTPPAELTAEEVTQALLPEGGKQQTGTAPEVH